MPAIAAINYRRHFNLEDLLQRVSRELKNSGLRLGGLIQTSNGLASCATEVHVVDLRTDEAFDIWEDRGQCASGCRLRESGLADASGALEGAIADRVDLLIINRFGRAESHGRGLIDYFAKAMDHNIPILTCVRPPYDEAWQTFHSGLAVDLEPDLNTVVQWALRNCCPAKAVQKRTELDIAT